MVATTPQPTPPSAPQTALSPLPPLSPADEALFLRFIESGASLAALATSLKDRPLPSPVHPLTSSPVPPPADPETPLPIAHSPLPSPPLPTAHSPLPSSPLPTAHSPLPSSPPLPTAHSPLPPSSLPSLYLWSTQPHIAAWIDFHEHQLLLDDQRGMRTFLKELVKAPTTNPIERRRAASIILRASPSGTHGRGGPRGGTPLRGVRNSPPTPRGFTSPSDSTSPELSAAAPSPSIPQSPELPPPLATPSPEISDSAAANLFLMILKAPRRPANIATLRAFCMPTARFDGVPIPTDQASFHTRAVDILTTRAISQHPAVRRKPVSTPSIARFNIGCGDVTDFSLELRNDSGPWLISRIEIGRFPEDRPP